MTSLVKTLENAVDEAFDTYFDENKIYHKHSQDLHTAVIYVSPEFYRNMRSDVNINTYPIYCHHDEKFMGYPIYIVNHDNHPDFKIYVEFKND